jgi:hypothetical protein
MTEARRSGLDHVVLPRRLPGLALLERYFPSPADNVLDAELAAFATPGDTVLDPWGGTGWTARRALAHGMRAIVAEPSPFAQLAAIALLDAPGPATLDAAFAQLAGSRRVDVPLRQHVEELYASRCAACRRPVVADQFIWPRDAEAPGRKIYRCAACDAALGGAPERSAPVDDVDLAKLGFSADAAPGATPAPHDVVSIGLPVAEAPTADDEIRPDANAGSEPPRFASTVRPPPVAATAAEGLRQSPHYLELAARFPVLDGRDDLVAEVLSLFTPRNLYALHAIGAKITTELRDTPAAAVMRLALAACLLPASRLNGYPGRVASLRISGGHVRQPASRHQREVNVWRAFEEAYRDVRAALPVPTATRRAVRFAPDAAQLGGPDAANVLWLRSRPAAIPQHVAPESADFVLTAPRPAPTVDELSFEYLATSWVLGREAAETLRLEPIFGAGAHPEGAEATALRHGMAAAAEALRPGGPLTIILGDSDPDRLIATALAASAAGLEIVDVLHRESTATGDGVVLHLRRPSAEDRLLDAVAAGPLRLGATAGHLTYPELATAIDRAGTALLRDRGEPAGLARLVCAVVRELAASGLLSRIARPRAPSDDAGAEGRLDAGGPHLLASLIREELWRDDHATLVRIGDDTRPQWWLRDPELAEQPLADRVEWSTWSILATAGRIDEAGFFDRIYRLFPGLGAPDEELVRACLNAYVAPGERGSLSTEDELQRRSDDHARVLATLVEYGHRLGLKAWVAGREHDRTVAGKRLAAFLADDERRVYLPLVIRGPTDALGQVDAMWYVRGRLAFLFEVEWTAMVGEAVLRRGRQIPVTDQQARFLVIPAERAELLRLKLDRSPWLRGELARQNWHILKWQHLESLAARPGAKLEWLEPVLGLDPLIERGGDQLTMFGE